MKVGSSGYLPSMRDAGLIVVGSGPAGVSAAEAFRRCHKAIPITIFTADGDLPYARPPLSKDYLRAETDDVALHPAQWFDEHRIEIVRDATMDHIDPGEHTVSIDGSAHRYRALVLACGASPGPLPVPGGQTALPLRSLADAARLRAASGAANKAVVVGAGFIGCEAAASLALRGLTVTMVAPQIAPQIDRLGSEAAERLLSLVNRAGVRFVGGVEVTCLRDGTVGLDNGSVIDADLVLAATGVRPECGVAEAAGLAVRDGRILVGADMRTSVDDVYAAGDVALALNTSAGRHLAVEHWQDAVEQGSVAGTSAAGRAAQWTGVPGFWTTIGAATVKYHAWGDGYQQCELVERGHGFAVWYEADAAAVGVLTYHADDDYELGEKLIVDGLPPPTQMR